MIGIFVFNTVGYKLWFYSAIQQADVQLEKSLDQQAFEAKDLFTVKVPLHLAYQNNGSNRYERVDGEVNVDGKIYRYVQRKVSNDTMYLQCVLHHEKIALEKKSSEYFGKANGFGADDHSKKGAGKVGFEKFAQPDFTDEMMQWSSASFTMPSISHYSKYKQLHGNNFILQMIKPPCWA